ncbi:MAG: hypothetical protein HKP41_16600 [Desulfobacterales bacterium]|nr:hypothetical protein [Desulfobacterales bacterium]
MDDALTIESEGLARALLNEDVSCSIDAIDNTLISLIECRKEIRCSFSKQCGEL